MRLDIRRKSIVVSEETRAHVERRLLFALGRFAPRVARVQVRLEDTNGPRGGIDKRCGLVVRLKPSGTVVLEEKGADLVSLIDRAADRLGRCVRRELDRRRASRARP